MCHIKLVSMSISMLHHTINVERKKKVMKVVESYVTKAGAEDEKIIDLNSLLLLINRVV